MTTESCFVCDCALIDSVSIKKRKRLHGKSCHNSKTVMNELLLETFGLPILAFKETHNPDALLCNHCDTQISNLSKYQVKVNEIKESLHQKITHLNKLQEESLPTSVIGKKQPSVSLNNAPNARRRLHSHQLHESTVSDQQAPSQLLQDELSQDQYHQLHVSTMSDQLAPSKLLQDDLLQDLSNSTEPSVDNEAFDFGTTVLTHIPQTSCRKNDCAPGQNNSNQPLVNNTASNHGSPCLSVSFYYLIFML